MNGKKTFFYGSFVFTTLLFSSLSASDGFKELTKDYERTFNTFYNYKEYEEGESPGLYESPLKRVLKFSEEDITPEFLQELNETLWKETSKTFLHWIIIFKDIEFFYLIKEKCRELTVSVCDEDGLSFLDYAIMVGSEEFQTILIENEFNERGDDDVFSRVEGNLKKIRLSLAMEIALHKKNVGRKLFE